VSCNYTEEPDKNGGMFIKLIEYDIKAGFTVLLPTGLPRHDPVVG